jgi:hypothetical protein
MLFAGVAKRSFGSSDGRTNVGQMKWSVRVSFEKFFKSRDNFLGG